MGRINERGLMFITRQMHDESKQRYESEITYLRGQIGELTRQNHELRLKGAVSLGPQEVVQEPVTPPMIVLNAIRAISPTQDEAYRRNYEYAMTFQEHFTNDSAMRGLADQIIRGSQPE
jgi:hypothetical protein